MKTRVILLLLVVALIALGGIWASLISTNVRKYPNEEVVVSSLQSFLITNGYQLRVENKYSVPSTPEPFNLWICGLAKHKKGLDAVAGRGIPRHYSHGLKYQKSEGAALQVELGVSGSRVYDLKVIGDTNFASAFPIFRDNLVHFGIPISFECTNLQP